MRKVLFLASFALCAAAVQATVQDSVGQKFIDGKRYVMYKVEAKETLYSLSKQYQTTVGAIQTANGGLIQGLQKDAIVLIPVASQTVQREKDVQAVEEDPVLNIDKKVQSVHLVSAGETLYSISKKYDVDLEDLKSWNNLTSNEISLGQELKISIPLELHNSEDIVKDKAKDLETDSDQTSDVTDEVKNNIPDKLISNKEPASKLDETSYTIDTSLYGEEVTETKNLFSISKVGIDQSKNLAQMTGVKPGTILMLVNPKNNKAAFVRVISGESEGVQVTNAVKTALGLISDDSIVKVSYTK